MPRQVKIWGCRGSVPTPGSDTVTYGGNTSCVEIALGDDAALVLDAGTGIRELGFDLVRRGTQQIYLFLTHLHLDHLEGLRFFAPLWNPEVTLDIWGPRSPVASLRSRILRAFSPPLFPAEVRFHDLPGQPWESHGLSLGAELVLHPGPTLGYRLETGASSLAYLPDHEPVLAGIADRSPDWISGGAVASGADLVLHDSQYLDEEYDAKIGWGHSSVGDAIAFYRAVGAGRLVLFHHEPQRSDRELDSLEARAQMLAGPGEVPPVLAREGMVFELD
jgi:phosphoribosyl 1,2-cyclic phosphodiesterase